MLRPRCFIGGRALARETAIELTIIVGTIRIPKREMMNAEFHIAVNDGPCPAIEKSSI
jgi:hypothetical protein